MSQTKRQRPYAGEGRIIVASDRPSLFSPLALLERLWHRLQGRKPKIPMTLTRDFYAKITSEPSYVILGEERYGMSRRIASIKKPKPNSSKDRSKS